MEVSLHRTFLLLLTYLGAHCMVEGGGHYLVVRAHYTVGGEHIGSLYHVLQAHFMNVLRSRTVSNDPVNFTA